jgi:hypothetical protein
VPRCDERDPLAVLFGGDLVGRGAAHLGGVVVMIAEDQTGAWSSSGGVRLLETTTEPWIYASPLGLKQIQFIRPTSSATVTVAF